MREKSIMLFDLYAGGHHGQHIQQLISYWGRHGLSGRLDVVVPAHFVNVHEAVVPLLDQYGPCGINLVPITEELHLEGRNTFGLIQADLEHGRLLKHYVERLRPDHCMMMYFDHAQLSLSVGLRFDFPVRISGTYFRPSFHYASISSKRPDLKQRILDFRKRLLLHRAVRNPHFDTLFCLDPFVIPHLRMPQPSTRAVALPDGIDLSDPIAPAESIRQHLGVEPGRKLLLLFGSLAQR
ncbi:MAG TPA: hypothetical protein VFG50_07285, partial [Rhodothermales bacterium]|nr:hypothetical protein [Rhodothermales bacterium]